MIRRQTSVPEQWLIADDRLGDELWSALRRLPGGSGVLIVHRDMAKKERQRLIARLRRIARLRGLVLADEAKREAARVHSMAEIRSAGTKRIPLLFLSPVFPTRSHPDWRPMPRMRAAALVRVAEAPAIALGGMDSRRFAQVKRLGFQGWAGIDAFRT